MPTNCLHVNYKGTVRPLDLHESGRYHRIGLEKDINRYRFFIFKFFLESLIRVQSSDPFHAKMNPTSCLFGSQFACAQTAIFSAEPCSKNAEEISIVLWITARE
jgi:hypothetical protein